VSILWWILHDRSLPQSKSEIARVFSVCSAISALAARPWVQYGMIGQDGHVWYSKAGDVWNAWVRWLVLIMELEMPRGELRVKKNRCVLLCERVREYFALLAAFIAIWLNFWRFETVILVNWIWSQKYNSKDGWKFTLPSALKIS